MLARFSTAACRACGNPIPADTPISKVNGAWIHTHCPPRQLRPVVPVSTPAYVPDRNLTAAEVGSYVLTSDPDTVYHVVETRDHARYYAEKFVVIGGERTTERGSVLNGDWQYETTRNNGQTERYSRLVARLLDAGKLRRMTADEVIDFATLYGRCVQHGGFLKSADSVDAGIGPVCAAKLGIDRKALAEAARRRRAATNGPASEPAATAAFRRDAHARAANKAQPATPPVEPPAVAASFEARYAAVFGDETPTTPAATPPATLSDSESVKARQRWADGNLPTDGFSVRTKPAYVRRRRPSATQQYAF